MIYMGSKGFDKKIAIALMVCIDFFKGITFDNHTYYITHRKT